MSFFGRIFGEGGGPIVSKRTIKIEGPLEIRDGHPVLSDEMRAGLERSGADMAAVEAALAGTPSAQSHTSFSGKISLKEGSGRTLEGKLEMQGGRPVLSDEVRAELERLGIDPAMIESRLAAAESAIEAGGGAVIHTERGGLRAAPGKVEAPDSEPEALYRKPSAEDLLRGPGSSADA